MIFDAYSSVERARLLDQMRRPLCTELTSSVIGRLDSSMLTVADSCRQSFTVRDAEGTFRLTVAVPGAFAEGTAPNRYDLGEPGWEGRLEIGSGLVVWPCHDIGSDFDDEDVREVWAVVGGMIEILDPTEMSQPVRALLHEVVLEAPDGNYRAALQNIEIVNSRWGWAGA